eukprot:TRINITY_DN468_c0_g1_i1.p1 TRINITY_DN468_c0_g1~~TRINITY_DN468_c0_g1_i1.p1  ORF type:complete len:156 (-),score=29.17 TRINITY_DN468_c0_g1_i1:405-845(-)
MSGPTRRLPIPDYHPFATLHKRGERHIVPEWRSRPFKGWQGILRTSSTFKVVATATFLSWMFVRQRHKTVESMTPEWKEAEAQRDREMMWNPIRYHVDGQPVVIPPEYYKHLSEGYSHYRDNNEPYALALIEEERVNQASKDIKDL